MKYRHIYLVLGFFFFVVGLVGVVLPVLPTTPFMLLALWAFSNSSERFHDWLYHHPTFGKPLQDWSQYGVVPKRAKISALVVMSISLAVMITFTQAHWSIIIATFCLMGIGATFILTRPSHIPMASDPPKDTLE